MVFLILVNFSMLIKNSGKTLGLQLFSSLRFVRVLTYKYSIMKIKHIKIQVLLAVSVLWVGGLQAQTSINSGGGDMNNANGSASYSLGQVFHKNVSNSSGSFEEGVQHAYIIETSGLENLDFDISLNVYPNPTSDYLTLNINSEQKQELKFNVFNMQGEEITQGKIDSQEIQINMIGLSSGTYFLNVLDTENQKIKNFKIIKK